MVLLEPAAMMVLLMSALIVILVDVRVAPCGFPVRLACAREINVVAPVLEIFPAGPFSIKRVVFPLRGDSVRLLVLTSQVAGMVPVAVIVAWVAACTVVIEAALATKPALKPMARSRERDFFTAMLGEGATAARLRVSRLFIKTMQVNNSKGLIFHSWLATCIPARARRPCLPQME